MISPRKYETEMRSTFTIYPKLDLTMYVVHSDWTHARPQTNKAS
jgi:hypothetical protein